MNPFRDRNFVLVWLALFGVGLFANCLAVEVISKF